ncbi:MAG: hypothetical protein OXH09_07595 [Gammaproteobacteria bacterium]|nr:hypothetical protein [Gammaproteobacteria bacterium]
MVRVERIDGRRQDRLLFESSEVAYVITDNSEPGGDGPFEVAKYTYRGYGRVAGPQRAEEWRRVVPMPIWSWARAPDGDWLAVGDGANRVVVLDTTTGGYALAFPTLQDAHRRVPKRLWSRPVPGHADGMNFWQWAWASTALGRLRGVLGSEATVRDVGRLDGFWFEDGNRLVLARSTGSSDHLRIFHDVFDMDTAMVDSGPDFRVEKDDWSCGLGGLRGLAVRNGRLTYPGPRPTPSDHAWDSVVKERENP